MFLKSDYYQYNTVARAVPKYLAHHKYNIKILQFVPPSTGFSEVNPEDLKKMMTTKPKAYFQFVLAFTRTVYSY